MASTMTSTAFAAAIPDEAFHGVESRTIGGSASKSNIQSDYNVRLERRLDQGLLRPQYHSLADACFAQKRADQMSAIVCGGVDA
ncbi:hypothetical protein JL720_6223 [Aureococcus anophagefferens]|nr:hypothetical protein JL720_6223 [Aureococcus anophagefferens]